MQNIKISTKELGYLRLIFDLLAVNDDENYSKQILFDVPSNRSKSNNLLNSSDKNGNNNN